MARSPEELNPSEWAVMKVIWDRRKATVREVHEDLLDQTGWAYSTVKTVLDRMQKKGLLRVTRVGPVKQFSARRRRKDVVPRAVETFLDRVLDDSFAPLVQYIARSRKLSQREVKMLERILKEDQP